MSNYTPAPEGYHYIFVAYVTDTKTGEVRYAKTMANEHLEF